MLSFYKQLEIAQKHPDIYAVPVKLPKTNINRPQPIGLDSLLLRLIKLSFNVVLNLRVCVCARLCVCSGPALILSRRLPTGQHTLRAEDTRIMNPNTADNWPSRPRKGTTALRNIKTLSCSPGNHKVVFPL